MPAHADFVCFRCENAEHGTGGPFRDLQITPKPKCPRCGARRWMQQQFSGYKPLVSTAEGRAGIAAHNLAGPELDRQSTVKYNSWRKPRVAGGPQIVSPAMLGATVASLTGGQIKGVNGLQPGPTKLESLRPLSSTGGLAARLQGPRPGPGSKADNSRVVMPK